MKDFKFKSYKFFTAIKNINYKRYRFPSFYKKINFRRYKFPNFQIRINLKKFNLFKIYHKINLRRYNFFVIYKKVNFTRFRYFAIYIVSFVLFLAFIYLSIPLFFNYNKTKIETIVCKGLNIECRIEGKISYSFFPSPRIKIENWLVKDFNQKNKNIAKIENLVIKLSIYNLLDTEKFDFNKILLKNAEINFNFKDLKEYKKFYKKKIYPKSVNLMKGKIKFFEGTKYITTIDDVSLKYSATDSLENTVLKGKFLNDRLYINLKSKKDSNISKVLTLKLSNLNFFAKIETFRSELDKNVISGRMLLKKEKGRLVGVFDYKDNQIILKHANLRNSFLDGKLNGNVKFFPYFDFNINSDLNSINFNKLYNILTTLNKEDKKNLFKINEKINGQLNLSANKIFSKHTLIHSFESRIKFIYGDILLEQLLLNLGKLGAADITGIIDNDKKFTNFKFETNIFLDNLKRFYNKFNIYNKQNISSHLFLSGKLNLVKLKLYLSEISNDNKFEYEDIAYIQKEFNKLLLEDGYASLFDFAKLKEFINLVSN